MIGEPTDKMIDAVADVKDRAGRGVDRDDIRHEVRAMLAIIERDYELRPKPTRCSCHWIEITSHSAAPREYVLGRREPDCTVHGKGTVGW